MPSRAEHGAYRTGPIGKGNAMSAADSAIRTIGFIGLGVMGEPMCGHLARRSGVPVLAHDLRPDPLERLAASGVRAATIEQIAAQADVIIMSLPDGKAVDAVVSALEPHLRAGQCVVDTSTSSVALTRRIGERLAAKGVMYADAPVARTREAAAKGELSIMVGATDETFARIKPILETMGSDVSHCGPVGCGQVVKILNNMLVFQHTAALAEAMAIGRRNGVPPDMLLPIMALGSGDSFVLRNHGMKAMLPGVFPERAFSTRYAMKDLSYALEMAADSGLDMPGAKLTMERLKQAEAAGYGENYHPVMLKVIDPQ
ncbi:NAD(P)-dependent oxidoreductase [Rhodopila sp.]|uniref:NAD(P)-dependent oxidoreductase n=1 Tax=Rhodopila sp. TaxID=2480087 RepID=UPI002D020F4B|nr:NAD(P)-dependent oxidoreductase [Rhodopila sp.]HVZ08069.1 NAD(P)-dependent oxidoreductase [Rhodopila sp.]